KELERLPHGAAADGELLGDLRLDEVVSRTEAAGEDLLADAVGGVARERPRSLDRRKPRPLLCHAGMLTTVDSRRGTRVASAPLDLLDRVAAVDHDALAGQVARPFAREEGDDLRDPPRAAGAAERRRFPVVVLVVAGGAARDPSRRDGVLVDA